MPINIPDSLPAAFALRDENIFYLTSSQAEIQDIRELRILILNLMPKKIETELHLLRMLSNSPFRPILNCSELTTGRVKIRQSRIWRPFTRISTPLSTTTSTA